MRAALTLAAAAALSPFAQADRLLFIPTARKLPNWTFRAEGFYNPGAVQWQIGYAYLALPPNYELEFRDERFGATAGNKGQGGATFDFTYNVVSPISDIAPGLAFGVQDALGTTPDGRRFFAAISTNTSMDTDLSHRLYIQTTLGVFAGKRTSPFLGESVPFGTSLRLLLEHNGYRPALGLELKPLRDLAFRYLIRDTAGYFSVQFTQKLR
jgi:hypothetical protein